jgi:hypothetical protein
MAYRFGAGVLTAIPAIDLTGAAVTLPTPIPFGILQDFTLDISGTLKELFGQYRLPVAVGAGTMKVTGKAKNAKFTAALFNHCFGETITTGERLLSFQEAGTIDKTLYTVNVAQKATFLYDLGVFYGANNVTSGPTADGQPLTRVSSGMTTGQYSVATGVYTFASGDNQKLVKLSYLYSTTAAPGANFTINNQLLGVAPVFQLVFNGRYAGKQSTIELSQVISNKLTLATKLEDFVIPEFDFGCFCDVNGILAKVSNDE